jgi:transcriptional regulator with XRE-family HTH domain
VAEPIDPSVWKDPDVRAALARRDIGLVYLHLIGKGYRQCAIAELTGQPPSEVSAIVNGRPVRSYDVLVRIAEGLGVPRGWMGLAYGEAGLVPASPGPEVSDDKKRRAFLAAASAAVLDRPVLGEALLFDQSPSITPLPAKVGKVDVAALRSLTEQMRGLGRAGHPGMPDVLGPIVSKAEGLLSVAAGSEAVGRALRHALAELHTLSGWCAYDMHMDDLARWHYGRALRLAAEVGDAVMMVSTVLHAAVIDRDRGAPNDSLKLLQLAQAKLAGVRGNHPRVPALQLWLHVQSAYALALMDHPDEARRHLTRAADYPPLADPFEQADMSNDRARIELTFGRIDVAEYYAASSVRTWSSEDHRRDCARARITLAVTHTLAGDVDAPVVAAAALDAVSELRSVRGKAMLAPLEEALSARRDSACADLAQRARELRAASAA